MNLEQIRCPTEAVEEPQKDRTVGFAGDVDHEVGADEWKMRRGDGNSWRVGYEIYTA